MSKENIEQFQLIRPVYESLGTKIREIINENLRLKELNSYLITDRAKSIGSFEEKIRKKHYGNPLAEITDLCGVRVIAYVEDDVVKICNLVYELFEVDESKSINKNDELGDNKVGYKSVHLICRLKEDRLRLPENLKYHSLSFEIQVRTILQHSWAEIEHDRSYKFAKVLPKELKRRLMLLSGTLELVDREFNQLSREIDEYSSNVKDQAESGELNIPIDSISLKEYLDVKFGELVQTIGMEPTFVNSDEQILREMRDFGLYTLQDLEDIIPDDFISNMKELYKGGRYSNYLGTLRDLMFINDIDKFVTKCFKDDFDIPVNATPMLSRYKVDLSKFPQDRLDYSYSGDI
jgi:putative GTP pyrophosphokinase